MNKEQRQQKKALKQKARRGTRVAAYKAEQALKAAHRTKLQAARKIIQGAESFPPLSNEEYVFWLCHGANFLASDSTTGLWAPIFEDIYQGVLPAPETIAQKVMQTYQAELEGDGEFAGVPKAVLAWTVTNKQIVTIYRYEAIRRLKLQDAECDADALVMAPHNPIVWAMMDLVKARSLRAEKALEEAVQQENGN